LDINASEQLVFTRLFCLFRLVFLAFRFLHSEDEDDEEEEADEQQDDEDADDLACGDRFNKPTD